MLENSTIVNSSDLLKPYFTISSQASSELEKIFDEALRLTVQYGNGSLQMNHVLYAIMAGSRGSATELFMSAGLDLEGFKANLLSHLQFLPKSPQQQPALSGGVIEALQGASQEAKNTNSYQVESVHFVLAAIKAHPDSSLWLLHDITYDKLLRVYTQNTGVY